MTISVRLNKEDTDLIKEYALLHNISISELVRQAVFEKIEDEYDLSIYNAAITEYHKNPVTYTMEEVLKEIGLNEV